MSNSPITKIVDVSQVIGEHYNQLTKSEKKIANFFNKNEDEATFLSAGEIASRLHLSEATMVRFARSLGFESYPAMRVVLQNNFRHRVTHSTRLRSRLNELRESGGIFERLVTSEIDYLTESLHTLDRDALDQAVELVKNHSRIFVFGLGPSVSLVDLLELRLIRTARHVVSLKTSGREMLEPLLLMNSNDLLIAVGFYNLTPNLQMALEHANKNNTPVILITDTLGPLIKDQVDVILAARRGQHSLIVPMTIINALMLLLSELDQANVMPNLDLLDETRQRQLEVLKNCG